MTERFGPSDVFVPGTIRNVLYITLVTGDFTQGRKTVGKNVEVLVTVRTARGLEIPNSLVRGSGEQPLNAFESTILYHNNNPTVRRQRTGTGRWDEPAGGRGGRNRARIGRTMNVGDVSARGSRVCAFSNRPTRFEFARSSSTRRLSCR